MAGANETIVAIEVVAEPIDVHDPLLAIPVEVQHVAVAVTVTVTVTQDYVKHHLYHCPLNALGAVFYLRPLAYKCFTPSFFWEENC